ncbi:hypothetical protein [Alteribacter lacisalsi]|uniref:hypothetical protein n=1 Tax=Alteribacter lacisalsi TaxID=2045244 RepID=UPI001374BFB1|nr:hypothetical protein [Alteribacter lacisalsi]
MNVSFSFVCMKRTISGIGLLALFDFKEFSAHFPESIRYPEYNQFTGTGTSEPQHE